MNKNYIYDVFCGIKDCERVWLYGDTHFTGVAEVDNVIIKNINSKVSKNDCLIILGDVGAIEPVKHLKGYKVLLLGNHDKGRTNYLREVDFEFKDGEKEITPTNIKSKLKIIDNRLFDEVYSGPVFLGPKILLSHEPIMGLNYCVNFHGHRHDLTKNIDEYHICCTGNVNNYYPTNLTAIVKDGGLSKIEDIHRKAINKRKKTIK